MKSSSIHSSVIVKRKAVKKMSNSTVSKKSYGVDVASYQSTSVSYAGAKFAIIKLTQGTDYLNPKADQQIKSAKAHGLLVGGYFYANHSNSVSRARSEAKYAVAKAKALGIPSEQVLKSLIVRGQKDEDGKYQLVMICLRGNHELNEVKAIHIDGINDPLEMATEEEINEFVGAHTGSLGPVGFKGRILVDRAADKMSNFACGANKTGYHLINVNWDKDIQNYEVFDLRNVEDGDPSPDGKGTLHLRKGIEVGQVFMLGTKYSEAMKATVKDANGKDVPMIMGCYGIGVTRAIAAVIEQHHDDRGIVWPESIAPFKVAIVAIKLSKSEAVAKEAEKLYQQLQQAGVDVLFDDRDERPGVMFADMELIGIPHIITIGEKSLNDGFIEYKLRKTGVKENISVDNALETILSKLEK